MPARAFTARATDTPDPDPVTFTVAGREFRCVPMAPAAAWETLTGIPEVPPVGAPGFRAAVVTVATLYATTIRYCLEPDECAKWDELVRTTYLDENFYADCAVYLLQTYTARVTPPDEPVEELDPLTLRQMELDRAAFDPGPPSPGEGLPANLAAILEAGGGFSRPT